MNICHVQVLNCTTCSIRLTEISLAFIYKAVYTAGKNLMEWVAVVAAYLAIIVPAGCLPVTRRENDIAVVKVGSASPGIHDSNGWLC